MQIVPNGHEKHLLPLGQGDLPKPPGVDLSTQETLVLLGVQEVEPFRSRLDESELLT